MRISVALCTYNGQAFLAEQLASIAAQSRPPDEMVVCDDGSTDTTPAILDEFAATAPFPVRLFRNTANLGSTRNFERAIGLCDGDVIATADQDDRWFPGKLARIEDEFAGNAGLGLVFSDARLIDGQGQSLGSSLWQSVRFGPDAMGRTGRGDAFATLLRRPAVTGATMAFRAQHRELVSPIPPACVHDEWIALLIAGVAEILPVADPLMDYRRHGQNQVGVSGLTVAERGRRTLARPFAEFGVRSCEFGQVRARIAEKLPDRGDLLAQVDAKIRHFRARADMPQSRIFRIPRVLREVVTLRYARYSGTAWNSVRDLLTGG